MSGNQSRQSPLHATPPSHLTILYNNQPDNDDDDDEDEDEDDDKYDTHP